MREANEPETQSQRTWGALTCSDERTRRAADERCCHARSGRSDAGAPPGSRASSVGGGVPPSHAEGVRRRRSLFCADAGAAAEGVGGRRAERQRLEAGKVYPGAELKIHPQTGDMPCQLECSSARESMTNVISCVRSIA